jgi:hypothetical protein
VDTGWVEYVFEVGNVQCRSGGLTLSVMLDATIGLSGVAGSLVLATHGVLLYV